MNKTRLLSLFALLAFHVPVWPAPNPVHVAQNDEQNIESELEEDDHSAAAPEETKRNDPDTFQEPAELTPPPREETRTRTIHEEPSRPSASSGEKIFDWSKYPPDVREVPHPFYEKGLIRITKDKTYFYKVDESDQKHAMSFKAGMFDPTNLENPDTGVTFEENYDQTSNPAFMFNYEWQLWQSAIGKLGIQAGTGFYVAQGNGHFVGTTNAGLTPREVFTFILMPVNLGAVYRLQMWHRQLFVPYGEGGGTVFGFTEMRDDNRPPKFGGSLGAYFAGGVATNLTYFDALSRINLDREYGINAVYLTVEFRAIVSLIKRYDFTSNLINAGFLMEY